MENTSHEINTQKLFDAYHTLDSYSNDLKNAANFEIIQMFKLVSNAFANKQHIILQPFGTTLCNSDDFLKWINERGSEHFKKTMLEYFNLYVANDK